jgi:hypothetical protein
MGLYNGIITHSEKPCQSKMSHFENPTPRYQHFILQLRQELIVSAGEFPVWRLSLENPHTGERKGFRTAEDLAGFLNEWMNTQSGKEQ